MNDESIDGYNFQIESSRITVKANMRYECSRSTRGVSELLELKRVRPTQDRVFSKFTITTNRKTRDKL